MLWMSRERTGEIDETRARVWERIVAERGKGERWRDIAQRAGLSERQCRRVYRAHMRSAPTLKHSDLEREIADAIAGYDADIEQLALISATTSSDCAKVAAVRARTNARSRKMELLRISGVLGDVRRAMDVRAVANAMTAAFDEHGLSDEVRRAVLAVLRNGAPEKIKEPSRVIPTSAD